jgi:hypothetical protein
MVKSQKEGLMMQVMDEGLLKVVDFVTILTIKSVMILFSFKGFPNDT